MHNFFPFWPIISMSIFFHISWFEIFIISYDIRGYLESKSIVNNNIISISFFSRVYITYWDFTIFRYLCLFRGFSFNMCLFRGFLLNMCLFRGFVLNICLFRGFYSICASLGAFCSICAFLGAFYIICAPFGWGYRFINFRLMSHFDGLF